MSYAKETRVIWTGSLFASSTRFRKRNIESDRRLIEELRSAYLPWYRDSSGADCNCDNPQASNFTVESWVNDRSEQVSPIRDRSKPIVIVTAYDAIFDDRIVVDGCKRCVSLAKYGVHPDLKGLLVEAYGDSVHQMFWCDFKNIWRQRWRETSRFLSEF